MHRHPPHRDQELIGDARDRNIEDIELLLANQMQEEVQWTLEPVELDHEGALSPERACNFVHIHTWMNAIDAKRSTSTG